MWEPFSASVIQRLFTQLLAAIYLMAFASLIPQIRGLYGKRGILPIAELLAGHPKTWQRFWSLPTLLWFDHSDRSLLGLCWLGSIVAALGLLGLLPPLIYLPLLYLAFLSICVVGREFMSFQWDVLLLESAVYAFLYNLSGPPATLALLLLYLLLFRLMFSSGRVKIDSGCPAWASWTAMDYHYWTQPLPNPLAWFMQQLPGFVHKATVAGTFFIELFVPFLIWTPLPIRFFTFLLLIGLQVVIFLTGNFAYFNLLSMVLCVPLLAPVGASVAPLWVNLLCLPLILLNLSLLIPQIGRFPGFGILRQLANRFYVAAPYGLFAVMTTERYEIIIEGSQDGNEWLAYEFPYKPGNPARWPPIVAPHQPRLDWQLWFAALRPFSASPWVSRLFAALLQGSPDVLTLLSHNPFPSAPPRYLRARLYRYRFTGFGSSDWWRREPAGVYAAPMSVMNRT